MRSPAIARTALLGLVALLSAGCVGTDYGDRYADRYPRVYRDDYDRGYRRPDYLQARRPYYRFRSQNYDRTRAFLDANNANRRGPDSRGPGYGGRPALSGGGGPRFHMSNGGGVRSGD